MIYILTVVIIICIVLFISWQLFCSIYEVKIISDFDKLEVNSSETAVIRIIPVNLLGKKIPFRKVPIEFNIIENKHLVSVHHYSVDNLLYISPKKQVGNIKILIKSKFSLFPSIIKISVIKQRN